VGPSAAVFFLRLDRDIGENPFRLVSDAGSEP